jgi:hypothetical protein
MTELTTAMNNLAISELILPTSSKLVAESTDTISSLETPPVPTEIAVSSKIKRPKPKTAKNAKIAETARNLRTINELTISMGTKSVGEPIQNITSSEIPTIPAKTAVLPENKRPKTKIAKTAKNVQFSESSKKPESSITSTIPDVAIPTNKMGEKSIFQPNPLSTTNTNSANSDNRNEILLNKTGEKSIFNQTLPTIPDAVTTKPNNSRRSKPKPINPPLEKISLTTISTTSDTEQQKQGT